mgnify:CR=1 FL=1
MAQERKTAGPSADRQGEESEAKILPNASLPGMKPKSAPVWEGTSFDIKSPDDTQEQGGLVTVEEWNQLLKPEPDWKAEDPMATFSDAEDLPMSITTDDGWAGYPENEAHPLLTIGGVDVWVNAFILAHALPRPDFRTVPWRRRL